MSIYRFETFSDEGERMFEIKEGKREIIKLMREINKLYRKAENIHHDLYLKDWKRKALDNYNEAFHENNSLPQ